MAVFPLMHAFADMLTFMQLQQVSCQLFIWKTSPLLLLVSWSCRQVNCPGPSFLHFFSERPRTYLVNNTCTQFCVKVNCLGYVRCIWYVGHHAWPLPSSSAFLLLDCQIGCKLVLEQCWNSSGIVHWTTCCERRCDSMCRVNRELRGEISQSKQNMAVRSHWSS
jgi:hypothetical protein